MDELKINLVWYEENKVISSLSPGKLDYVIIFAGEKFVT